MFKLCGCGRAWPERQTILEDGEVRPIGMVYYPPDDEPGAPHEDRAEKRLFMVNCSCGSTLAIDADDFGDLVEPHSHPEIRYGGEGCEGHCTRIKDLEVCDNDCLNAPFRRFLVAWAGG